MADLPDPTSNGGASTLESDDISSLLNTLLQNSSQISTSAHLTPLQNQPHEIRRQFPVSVPFDSSSCVNLPFFSSGLNDRVENPFLTSIPFTMEGIGHADCESEEQEEGLVHRVPARSSSKRSRAAEVHNLSEKRRRQRINEKMKALQKLIPNSNKTDKASMLDEAIEYLKQLQLQVQMLTMRNGSSLHPFYMPGLAQSTQLSPAVPLFDESNSSRVGSFPANQEASMQPMFDLSTKNAPSDYKSLLTRMLETNNNSRTTFAQEPSTNAHNRPFNATMLSKVLCKDSSLPQSLLETSHCGQSSSSGVSS